MASLLTKVSTNIIPLAYIIVTLFIKTAVDDDTRAIFCESIANPGGYITDLVAIAAICDRVGLPLIVDNTTATPYLCNPIKFGATLVTHSTTKFLTGNGTVTGGCVVDSGKFDWAKSGKFPSLSEPEAAYHGLKFSDLGPMAFTFHGIAIGLRDLGMTMNPQGAHYTLCGIETLSLRMERHVRDCLVIFLICCMLELRALLLFTVVVLGSPSLLPSCLVFFIYHALALHNTIILIITHKSFNPKLMIITGVQCFGHRKLVGE